MITTMLLNVSQRVAIFGIIFSVMTIIKGKKQNKSAIQSINDKKYELLQSIIYFTLIFLAFEYFGI